MSNNEPSPPPVFDLLYIESVFFIIMLFTFFAAWVLGLNDTPERTFDDASITYIHGFGAGALWLFVRFVRLS
jgi:hypothetical protein